MAGSSGGGTLRRMTPTRRNLPARLSPLLLAPLLTGSGCRADELVFITDLSKPPPRAFTANESKYARQNLDEYARSSSLPVLNDGDGDQLRVWVTVVNFNVR